MTTLHCLNNEFAAEHEKLQNELQTVQRRCADYEQERQKGCESCRTLAKQNQENQLDINRLSNENGQLNSDMSMMKVLIYRLNVQLENYQEMLRKQDIDGKNAYGSNRKVDGTSAAAAATIDFENIESIDWGCVHSHVLAPLLNAYQESIKEKSNLVKQYEVELNQTTGRIKDIIAENEELYANIENIKQLNDNWQAEKVRLQAQVDVCR